MVVRNWIDPVISRGVGLILLVAGVLMFFWSALLLLWIASLSFSDYSQPKPWDLDPWRVIRELLFVGLWLPIGASFARWGLCKMLERSGANPSPKGRGRGPRRDSGVGG
jgi:hypothetical protein